MEGFTLAQVAEWTQGELKGGAALTEVSTDSRKIPSGALFVPIKGENFDGHDFIGNAVDSGAGAVVSHRADEEYTVPVVYVQDTSRALLDIARGYRTMCGGKVVGVTGSVGKTTTKEMMYAVLANAFKAQCTEGNHNNEVGVPLTLFSMTKTTEVMVAEMGMNHFGELSRISGAACPDIAVITNIGTSHIEYLGSREGILKAKLEILEGLKPEGCAVICGDDPLLWGGKNNIGHRVYTYGIKNPECDLIAHLHDDGTFDIINRSLETKAFPTGGSFAAKLNIPGEHNVLNALAAAAVGLLMGEEAEDIVKGLASYNTTGMRQHIFTSKGFNIYADCYNASPDAMEAVLKVLGKMKGGRRFAVLGSMMELGDYSKEGHRRAGYAAAENADVLYAYGPAAAYITAGARERGMSGTYEFDDHVALASALRDDAKPGDTLLFKGSRAMRMEQALALFLGEDVE